MKRALILSTLAAALLSTGAQAFESQHAKACTLFASGKGYAAPKEEGVEEKTYKALTSAQTAIQGGKWKEALAVLEPALASTKAGSFDQAQVNVQLSYVYGQLRQFDKAISAIKSALATKTLNAQTQLGGLQNLGYLYVSARQPDNVAEAFKDYAAAGGSITADMYGLLGQSYAEVKQWQKAICPTKVAIDKSKTPKQTWYDVALSAHWELKDFVGAEAVLKEAIVKFPNEPKNWQQLSKVYLSKSRDKDALDLLIKGYEKGIFTQEDDLRNIAALYIKDKRPADGAAFLENGVKSGKVKANETVWKQIAQTWSKAGKLEKVSEAYGEAAKLAKTGQYDFYQATIFSEQNKWPQAIAAFKRALDKKGLTDEGQGWLYLGIAQFRNSEFKNSMTSLNKAEGYESSKKEAQKMKKMVEGQMK